MDPRHSVVGLIAEHAAVGESALVTVTGELDLATQDQLRKTLTQAAARSRNSTVVLDLRGVTFLGSRGLVALVDTADRLAGRGGSLRLVVGTQRAVVRSLKITGLDAVMPTFTTVEEALTGLAEG
jgi:anti-anti-sigma factor